MCSMCSRAIARAAPPTKYKFLPGAANNETVPASARSVASETALALSPSSARRSGPSGSVTPRPISADFSGKRRTACPDLYQFDATPAQVDDQPIGFGYPGEHAGSGQIAPPRRRR